MKVAPASCPTRPETEVGGDPVLGLTASLCAEMRLVSIHSTQRRYIQGSFVWRKTHFEKFSICPLLM